MESLSLNLTLFGQLTKQLIDKTWTTLNFMTVMKKFLISNDCCISSRSRCSTILIKFVNINTSCDHNKKKKCNLRRFSPRVRHEYADFSGVSHIGSLCGGYFCGTADEWTKRGNLKVRSSDSYPATGVNLHVVIRSRVFLSDCLPRVVPFRMQRRTGGVARSGLANSSID